MTAALALGAAALLGVLHPLMGLLERQVPRAEAAFASFAGGASLAYVFLYLLFHLANEGARAMHARFPLGPAPLETLFLILLVAVCVYYVVTTASSRRERKYRVEVGVYIAYNALVGVALIEQALEGPWRLTLYTAALGMHMMFNHHFLRLMCPGLHRRRAAVALALAPVLGCALALALGLPESVLYVGLTLVAGATIVNVVREELPGPEALRPLPFMVGVAGFGMLILGTWRF